MIDLDKISEQVYSTSDIRYKLVREKDGLVKQSIEIKWLEFDESFRGKKSYDEIAIGRSLIMSPFNVFFTWHTTLVTEIVEQREDYIKFKTKNSTYQLYSL